MQVSRLLPLLVCVALSTTLLASEADDVAGLLAKGRADDALHEADQALAKSPRDARLRLLRGNALTALGQTNEAIQTFTALTRDYPALPEAYNNLAAIYAEQGQLDLARSTLQRALQTNVAYATAQANLTDVYAKLAAEAYTKALERDVVERQHHTDGTGPPPTTAPTRLSMMQDIVSRGAGTVAGPARPIPVLATPIQVAVAHPASAPSALRAAAPRPTPRVVAAVTVTPVALPRPVKPAPAPRVLPTSAPKSIDAATESTAQVVATLHGWAKAWSERRVGVYLSYYGHSFKPPHISRSVWEKERRERIEAARKIDVELRDIKVKLEGGHAMAHFVQTYRSNRLSSSTGKTMVLEKSGGRWLITAERVR